MAEREHEEKTRPAPHRLTGRPPLRPEEPVRGEERPFFTDTLPSFNQPYWTADARRYSYPVLSGDLECDITVVGGGITGLTAAMRLADAGKRVVLVDMNRVGGGTTGHSTGHLDNCTDQGMQSLIAKFGEADAGRILRAKREAIDQIERWDTELGLQSLFRRIFGYLYAEHKTDVGYIEKEHEAARRLGIRTKLLDNAPLPFPTKGALRFPDQARFHPLRYVYGLARAFVAAGGRIFETTVAQRIEGGKERTTVVTDHGELTSGAVVLAGHCPLIGTFSLQTRNYPHQSYVVGARVKDEVPDALFWDTADPYNYTRLATSDDAHLLIVGGADHHTGKKSNTRRSLKEMERYVRQHYRVEDIAYRWSAEYFEPADGAPYIGAVPGVENVYVGTGFSGDGLTFGTVAGLLMSDLILGRDPEWGKPFSPSRLKPAASARRALGGVGAIVGGLIGDRMGRGDVESVKSIVRGQGAVVKIDGQRYAVYRDEDNALHSFSAACRHMECIVHWNAAEKTWDCPCHGGRYDAYGRVIAGPPSASLEARSLPPAQSKK